MLSPATPETRRCEPEPCFHSLLAMWLGPDDGETQGRTGTHPTHRSPWSLPPLSVRIPAVPSDRHLPEYHRRMSWSVWRSQREFCTRCSWMRLGKGCWGSTIRALPPSSRRPAPRGQHDSLLNPRSSPRWTEISFPHRSGRNVPWTAPNHLVSIDCSFLNESLAQGMVHPKRTGPCHI